jgi:hypothetical protein
MVLEKIMSAFVPLKLFPLGVPRYFAAISKSLVINFAHRQPTTSASSLTFRRIPASLQFRSYDRCSSEGGIKKSGKYFGSSQVFVQGLAALSTASINALSLVGEPSTDCAQCLAG